MRDTNTNAKLLGHHRVGKTIFANLPKYLFMRLLNLNLRNFLKNALVSEMLKGKLFGHSLDFVAPGTKTSRAAREDKFKFISD